VELHDYVIVSHRDVRRARTAAEQTNKRLDGPGAARDPGNLATTVGAGFIVGGWL
jgi:hypothetical protein